MSIAYGAFFSTVVLVPLWLQINLGYTATWAGRATAFTGYSPSSCPHRRAHDRDADSRYLVSIGMLVFGVSTLWRSTFTTDIDFMRIVGRSSRRALHTVLFLFR